jgi:class 3 adenylate cyclase/tetratricopeptide (TPR) repeat protein
MRCLACHTENRPAARFCEACGSRLESTCVSCGAPVTSTARFCDQCGAAIASKHSGAPGSRDDASTAAVPAAAGGSRFASPHSYTPAHLAARILKDRSALSGERKQVTVLFADVSQFTSLSEHLDPEDVHALINRAFEIMLAEVHRFEGTVNQFLGDGLMALFGAPVAHEDHALRAAHAALAMQAVLGRFRADLQQRRAVDFGIRMGLNTGLVVVGAIGDNLRMDYTAVGDTTNTAARLQQLAEPGQVVVSAATRRLIAPYFETRALGTFAVKHREQPVAAWELVRARARISRLEARAALGLSPFVGRDDAITTLGRAFSQARAGRGQAVFVVGDAGIGKSRLLLEFRHRVRDQATWIEGDCISFGQPIPFLPIVEMLKRQFEIGDRDAEAEVIEKVERGVAFLGEAARAVAPFVRYLLAVDPGDQTVVTMDPAQRRARIMAAIQGLTAEGSRRRPIVLVVEDAHWIDDASEDLLRRLIESLPGMAVLLLLTYRPTYQQPYGDRTYHWRIALQPVDEDAALRIVEASLGVTALPRELARAIAGKAEGNPFFLEEIGHNLVETGAVRAEDGQLVLAHPAASLSVPETVQDLIAARLDRLEESQKRTVQTASVIGREFGLELLQRVSDLHEQLEDSLRELERIELIYEKVGLGALEYVFRHALTQDVAYASLLQSERRRLHSLIGRAIEEVYTGRLEERTEELVHHFTRGEAWDKVLVYAREAAERAAGLCVDERAVEHYETALRALQHLPETPDTARVGIEVRLAMRAPLWRGGHPDRLFALFKEAEALAIAHGFPEYLDTVYAFLVQYHWAKGEHDDALAYGRRCVARATDRGDLGLRITGLFYLCHSHYAVARYAEGVRTAREIIDALEGPRATERFGLSGFPYSGACALGAECLVQLGDFVEAMELLERGQRAAEGARHLYSEMVLAAARGNVLTAAGRVAEAVPVLEAAVTTCRDKRFVGQLINSLKHLASAYVEAGRPGDALAPAQEAIDLQEQANVCVVRGIQHTALARAHLALGDLDAAAREAGAALSVSRRRAERGVEAWAGLVSAEVALALGNRTGAAALLDQAQRTAEELGMRPVVDRCLAVRTTVDSGS